MSEPLVCPVCGESYRDEDFCPVHGVALVARRTLEQPPTSASPGCDDAARAGAPDSPAQTRAAETTDGSGPAMADSEAAGRLAQFMSRMGLRAVRGAAPPAPGDAVPDTSLPKDARSPLPPDVVDKGWRVSGQLHSRGGVDSWPVERPTDSGLVMGEFRRYRTGALTTVATYRRLAETTVPCMARIWAHGTVDFGGARADYDLISVPMAGVALDSWFAETQASEQRARHLYPGLVRLLQRLAVAGIQPIAFDPSQLLRADDGEICLTSAGAMAEQTEATNEAVIEYRPEFARSALLPHDWAAPELLQQTVLSANAAVFSLGQVLAQAIWGQPCSHAELQTGAIPFHGLADERLARVLMGCLWARPAGRWTVRDLATAVTCPAGDALPSVSPWASLTPGASSRSFSLAGESFWRLEDLLAVATQPSHWAEARSRIEAILDWAEGTAWVGQARLMRRQLANGRSADWALVGLSRAVRPDAPSTWRALDLSDGEAAQSLARLAQGALRGSAADAATMNELFKADLRGAFTPADPGPSSDE